MNLQKGISLLMGLATGVLLGLFGVDVLFSSVELFTSLSGDQAILFGIVILFVAFIQLVAELAWIREIIQNR